MTDKRNVNCAEAGKILKLGITGFGQIPSLTITEIKNVINKIKYPYICQNITEPQINNNYFSADVRNTFNGRSFKLLINDCYYFIAGITMENRWMELNFIDLPDDFICQIKNDAIVILNKNILDKNVPNNELKILGKEEIKQINYWKSKTYGEIIFNGYD
jgi:hypothetical protein